MNRTPFTRFTLAALLAAASALPLSTLRTVQAQPPSGSVSFTTRIYVQNPNPNPATAVVNFYDLTGAPQPVNVPLNLPANGSTEILIGNLTGLGSPWRGSAVISADQPVVAASIQVPPSGYGHIMANAFTSAEASDKIFLTTFLAIGNPTNAVSLFGVQNTEAENINIRAQFVLPNGLNAADVTLTLPAYTSKFFDGLNPTTTIASGLHGFNGSVVVTATKVSNGTPALIVGSSEERRVENTGLFRFQAYGFEAIPQSAGATTVYMPTALCNFALATTYFAVQNLSFTMPTVVTITYSAVTGTTPTQITNTVSPLAKWSVNPCQSNGNQPFSGAAVIQSSVSPVAAIGKARQETGANPRYVTAYRAEATSTNRLAIPFVRWSPLGDSSSFRSYIAIQNIGTAVIPAGQLTVTYYSVTGAVINTCVSQNATPVGAKQNSNVAAAFPGTSSTLSCSVIQPSNGDAYTFAGSAIVQGPPGSALIAIVRNSPDPFAVRVHTEDMNAIPLP